MNKLSKYVVFSDLFTDPTDNSEKVIVYSTRTNEMSVLTRDEFRFVKGNTLHAISSCLTDKLAESKVLVPEDENELEIVIRENLEAIKHDQTLFISIQPTASCQLGCDYCAQKHTAKKLDQELEEKIVDRIINKLIKGGYKSLELAWFGAEPLTALSSIRRISNKIFDFIDENSISYNSRIVTNGINLTNKIAKELFSELRIEYAEITLDGIAEYHNKRRMYKKGEGTFDIILNNIEAVVNDPFCCLKISIRCNVDKRNKDAVIPLLDLLALKGLDKKVDNFYVAPIRSWGNDVSSIVADMESFGNWEIEWFAELKRRGMKFTLLPKRKKILCMAVRKGAELFDSYGDIYNCSEVSYIPQYEEVIDGQKVNKYSIGHINKGMKMENEIMIKDFYSKIFDGNYNCNNCEMLPTCGGSCPKSWLEGEIPCPPAKFNIKNRLLLSYFLNKEVLHIQNEKSGGCQG
ncbi:radical SAM/SPASM domain-containing protein [Segetibacter koreensis]|uniref:radical SAM/SPASM domain-containing protein n=1 Tax=Segetibacter koreensis TaxID=398037 RepID=UPI00036973AA|nr:radical SAM protein [Segetibacter koreensis]